MKKHNKIGQITVKKIGKKFAACISGTPQQLFDTFVMAESVVEKLRKKHGRRNYKCAKTIRGGKKTKK